MTLLQEREWLKTIAKDMLNKNRYNFFKNTKFALEGLVEIFKHENAFRIELFCILPLGIFSLFLEVSLTQHILLIAVLFLILVVECINSAIERCVDLVTKEYNILAKQAKDAGSAAVFISISLAVITWFVICIKLITE